MSVYTETEAIGMLSGFLEVPIVPEIGDAIRFDLARADPLRHKAIAGIEAVQVTARHIPAFDECILLALSDITVGTRDDALQVIAFFEDCHGLFGDIFDDDDLVSPED